MWGFIQAIVTSVIIIVLLHYGWEYVKTTYSIHKTKDLVKIQTEKYDTILSELLDSKGSQEYQINTEEMENDLVMFMRSIHDAKQEEYDLTSDNVVSRSLEQSITS